ncbi:MAG: BON domain-containing protein [Bdellovibrionales bacterium]|nr:BON domain-containing protein [Bdellovibrionales bacterium]
MKRFNLFLSILLIFFTTQAFAQQQKPVGKKYITIYMGIQHQEVLSHLPPGSEFFGDFRDFVEGELDRERKTLRFIPKKVGLSTLTIHDRKGQKLFEYRIDVRKSQLTKVVREVRSLLRDIEGITIKIVNNKVIIDGKVLLPRDLNRIYGVIKEFGEQVSSLVEINPIAQKKIAEIIERDINNPDIEVRAINGKFILKGIANSQDEKAKAEIIAKTYVPPPIINEAEAIGKIKKRKEAFVINLLQIRASAPPEPKKTIQLVVHYVEMSKKYLNSSSFRWTPGIQDNSNVSFTRDTRSNNSGIITEISGIITGLLPKLNYAKQHGHARILQSTSVTTKDGQKGVVSSTEQIPFNVRQPSTAGDIVTTQFATVGVSSEITPKIVNPRSDMIELGMQFSVSAPTGESDAGPTTSKNMVQTTVNVRSGQSAAVGGLIKNTSGTDYNPENVDDAIIALYASKKFRNNKSQFVIFVTPIIRASASAGSERIKRKFRLRD